jgi:hypothetical protein
MQRHHIIIWIAIDNPPSEDNMLYTKAGRLVFFRVKLKKYSIIVATWTILRAEGSTRTCDRPP